MSDFLLRLDSVGVSYGGRQGRDHAVLKGLSLALAEGEIGCLLGPSGCGKTTALRAIAGFEPIREGAIHLNGDTIATPAHQWPPQQRGIGMVFQDYALFPHLSVAGNVAFGLHGWDKPRRAARVAELLEIVGLAGHADDYVHALSGGQQQRVALARALAPSPRLLLLDEPFSNLDVELRERLSQEVRDILKAQGMTALLVTHDQHEAFALADRIGVLKDGQLRQWDTAYALYHQPTDRFVADFIGEGAFLPGTVVAPGEIEFELGKRACLTTAGCGVGDAINVLLRPDDIIHDDASPLHATVVKKAFRGAQFLYTLALPSGNTLLSLVPSHHDHAIGEGIGIRVEIDHVIAFP
ncbi:ABC transporter ATP-binding protein [Chitinimonas sp. BJYL2]|uniref:ABC transporter ATP-binding protein n=1 Tax=Chitinimonas sp. BJYL2 TaxID=2976696 RepID=UPI0027E4D3EA|nr:ABC transporter ATP-binding protein [Chitinimonas sp. BJYL2]